jgi:hypothetical protein
MLSYNDVFDELQNYILDEVNMQKSLRMKISNSTSNYKNDKIIVDKNITKKPELFIPRQQDTLFWCFYIMKNGDANYESLYNKNSLVAKQLKIDLVSIVRKNKDTLKTYKFDTKTNIESNLANDNNINSKTFLSLCAIDNINVIYIRKKTYYELLMNDTNIIYIVHEIPSQSKYNNKYGFEMATEELLDNIKKTLYKVENVNKPIKALSSYKVQDIIDICSRLAIETTNKETGKTKTKNELYETIIQYF